MAKPPADTTVTTDSTESDKDPFPAGYYIGFGIALLSLGGVFMRKGADKLGEHNLDRLFGADTPIRNLIVSGNAIHPITAGIPAATETAPDATPSG